MDVDYQAMITEKLLKSYRKENKERPLKSEPCINFRAKLTWRWWEDGWR